MSVLGPVKPFFTYAAELRSVPIMAYHCKLYAVQKGFSLCKVNPGDQAKLATNYLMQELQDLEVMKKAMGDVNKDDMQVAVENFVISVFARAEKDELTVENIGKVQAVAWRRAGHFIDVITVFGPLTPEWEQRRKYANYKAGIILKCLKSGEEPPRGNPFETEEEK